MPLGSPAPPYIKIEMRYQISSQECVNIFYYDNTLGTSSPAEASAIGAQFALDIGVPFTACVASDVTMTGFLVEMRDATQLYETFEPSSDTGDIAGEALPAQDVVVMLKGFANNPGTRISRGRWFFSGLSEGQQQGGFMLPAAIPNWTALANACSSTLTVGGNAYQPMVFRPSGMGLTALDFCITNTQIKTLRRRRPSS